MPKTHAKHRKIFSLITYYQTPDSFTLDLHTSPPRGHQDGHMQFIVKRGTAAMRVSGSQMMCQVMGAKRVNIPNMAYNPENGVGLLRNPVLLHPPSDMLFTPVQLPVRDTLSSPLIV